MNTSEINKVSRPEDERPAESGYPEKNAANAMPAPSEEVKKRTKPPSIENLAQLLRAIYNGQFKRATLTKAELAAIRSAPGPSETERDDLFRVAQSDRLLERTRELMLLGIRLDGGAIAGQVSNFAQDILKRHPLFQSESLTGVLTNLPEALSEERAVTTVLSMDCAALPWPEEEKPSTKKQCEQCRTNAAYCLLLLFWVTRGTSLGRIQHYLQAHLWASASRRHKSDSNKLCALISSRDPAAASVTFGLLEKQATEQRHRAETATRAEDRAVTRAMQLEGRLADVERNLAEAKAETDQIRQKFEETIQAHATAKAHWQDDYERLRGQMLHCLKGELELLDEGLHALRRDPPKVRVMIDHAERAIDGLKREMERLRGNR